MATSIVPKLSKTNPYYISKHRYYELKHFCLQYPEWQREIRELKAKSIRTTSMIFQRREKHLEDKVSEIAIQIFFPGRENKKSRSSNSAVRSLDKELYFPCSNSGTIVHVLKHCTRHAML